MKEYRKSDTTLTGAVLSFEQVEISLDENGDPVERLTERKLDLFRRELPDDDFRYDLIDRTSGETLLRWPVGIDDMARAAL